MIGGTVNEPTSRYEAEWNEAIYRRDMMYRWTILNNLFNETVSRMIPKEKSFHDNPNPTSTDI